MTGNDFEDLNLSEILQISSADADHSQLLHAQASAMRKLSDSVGDGLDAIIAGRNRLENGARGWSQLETLFEGTAAEATFTQLTKLLRRGTAGHAKLREQPRVFENLADETSVTHSRVTELREERAAWLAKVDTEPEAVAAKFGGSPGSPASLRQAVRDDYNQQARQYMRGTTRGYIKSARNLEWAPQYQGPRSPRPEDTDGPAGWHPGSTLGPELRPQPEDEVGPTLQNNPTLQGHLEPGTQRMPIANPAGKTLSPLFITSGPVTVQVGGKGQGKGKKHKKRQKRRARTAETSANPPLGDGHALDDEGELQGTAKTGSDIFAAPPSGSSADDDGRYTSDRVTTSPVIGSRAGGGGFGSTPPPPAVDNRGGLLPPVLGNRGAPGASPDQAQPGTRGVVIAAKDGKVRSKRTFLSNPAGTRFRQPAPHLAEGRVIRGDQERPAGEFQSREFSRAPRVVHGGDDPNRAVIRNSRLPAPSVAPVEPASADPGSTIGLAMPSTEGWYDAAHAVPPVIRGSHHASDEEEEEFNPGPFITRYNLGRQS